MTLSVRLGAKLLLLRAVTVDENTVWNFRWSLTLLTRTSAGKPDGKGRRSVKGAKAPTEACPFTITSVKLVERFNSCSVSRLLHFPLDVLRRPLVGTLGHRARWNLSCAARGSKGSGTSLCRIRMGEHSSCRRATWPATRVIPWTILKGTAVTSMGLTGFLEKICPFLLPGNRFHPGRNEESHGAPHSVGR